MEGLKTKEEEKEKRNGVNIGVAPFNINNHLLIKRWYLCLKTGLIFSVLPHNYFNENFVFKKYDQNNNEIEVIMNFINGILSFKIGNDDEIVVFENILNDKKVGFYC